MPEIERITITDPRAVRRVAITSTSVVGLGTFMERSVYDPAGIENDAFDLAYHYGVLENAAAEIDGGLI